MRKLIIIVFLLTSCNWADLDTKKSGIHKNSQSIAESKENGVFRRIVNINKSIISIGNNRTDTVKEIWMENIWMYSDKGGILKDSAEQLLILFGNSSKVYNDKLFLETGSHYFEWNGVFSISNSNLGDTIFVVPNTSGNPKINQDTILLK